MGYVRLNNIKEREKNFYFMEYSNRYEQVKTNNFYP